MTQRTSELLHHQVERFEGLLADLLEMSRFDAGAAELSLNEVDLLGLTKEVLLTAKPLADQSETPVYLVVQGEDFRAEVDHRRIDRILRNLINNAIEHSEGRPVDIVIAASPTAVGVAVRDYGVGMTSEEVSRVFDRFWRADPARARTTGGSGLGLAIATEDTRLHSGSLDAWGQKGQGSCFRLVLPRSQEAPYRAAPLALPPSYATHERQSVEDRDLISAAAAHERVHEQALNDQPLSAAARAEDAPEPGAAEDDDEEECDEVSDLGGPGGCRGAADGHCLRPRGSHGGPGEHLGGGAAAGVQCEHQPRASRRGGRARGDRRGVPPGGAGPQDDYAVARQYLTPEASQEWVPDQGTRVYSDEPELIPDGDSAFTLQVPVDSSVDAVGTMSHPRSAESFSLEMEEVEGEWRIASRLI